MALTFFHTLTHIPVDESSLGVHEIEFVVQSREHLGDGGRVGDHAHGPLDLGQVASGHHGGGLVVDTALESGRAPVDELNGSLGLDGGDGGVDILWHDVTWDIKYFCLINTVLLTLIVHAANVVLNSI